MKISIDAFLTPAQILPSSGPRTIQPKILKVNGHEFYITQMFSRFGYQLKKDGETIAYEPNKYLSLDAVYDAIMKKYS